MFQQPLSNERGMEGQRRFEDRAVTPCGQQRSRQGSGQDCPRAPFLTARPPPVSLPESPWVGSLAFLPTTALPAADLSPLPPPPTLSPLPFPTLTHFYSGQTMPLTMNCGRTGSFGAAACISRTGSGVGRKKGRQNPWTMNTFLPLCSAMRAYLTLCSAAAYYDDGEKGLWKQSNRRGCFVAK